LAAGKWLEVASYTDIRVAEEFKSAVIRSAVEEEEMRATELAEERRDPHRIPARHGPYWYARHYGVSSVEELQSIAPLELVARLAEAEAPTGAYAADDSYSVSRQVLGHVQETHDIAHVVYRCVRKSQSFARTSIETMPMKRVDGRWYIQNLDHLHNFIHPYPPA
jgi:hypothetical protein